LISKAPQIISNHRLQSTGNLSAFAVFNAFAGCLARLFTTSQETGDSLVWWGFALAAALNAVLAGQMIMYWNVADDYKSRPLTDTILGEKRGSVPSRKIE
jgi:mannose-P-dolichol utilization defect protein 1